MALARDLLAFENDIDLRWIAAQLAENYAQCRTHVVDGLVGATPEMLVRREAGLATSPCWPAPSVVPAMMIMISTWRRHWPDRARTWRSTSTRFAPWPGRCRFPARA